MQLKFKKICLFATLIVYFLSFFLQNGIVFFQTLAQEKNIPRTNIVVILVDSSIKGIDDEVKSYATYVQSRLSDTKALVIPLNLENIHAYDIYRMMENIYFDGLKDINSSLIGLVMIGDIPLPVVNQDGYIFPTVYPYVDFENQKYAWNSDMEYFVPNGNSMGQAEIWHGLINYGTDTQAYLDYFAKIEEYSKNPDSYIGDGIWYDDFIAQREGFLDENYPYYKNRVIFAEDLGYQRYSPLMRKIFRGWGNDTATNIVSDLSNAVGIEFDGKDIMESIVNEGVGDSHTTKMIQQEIETSFLADYNNLFSVNTESMMRENVFAGGRWIKEIENSDGGKKQIANVDTTAEKIQIKDELILGNENLQGLIENLNDLMETTIDKKIRDNNLSMDIVVPVSYKKVTGKRVSFKCHSFVERYDNYYFGSDARLIDEAENLSIYRGTYRNLSDLSGVTYESLSQGNNSAKSVYDNTDLKLKSIGGSYDIFSNQVEGNRGYSMLEVEGDLDIYDEHKTQKDSEKKHKSLFGRVKRKLWPEHCSDDDKKHPCEGLSDFSMRRWGGASAINLVMDSVSKGLYELSGYLATDSWRSIYSMGGFQSLREGKDEGSFGTGWYHGTGVGPQWDATSFKAYMKYSSPTQREGWRRVSRMWLGKGYELYENHTPDVHIPFSSVNYFNLNSDIINSWIFSKDMNSGKIFSIEKDKGGRCGGGEQYTYKVIDSVVKHTSTTEDQINGIYRDKYGENGKLTLYYHDVKTAYDEVKENVDDILGTLPEIIDAVNSGNEYMDERFSTLSGEFARFRELNYNIGNLTGIIESKNLELENLNQELLNYNLEMEAKNQEMLDLREQLSGLQLLFDGESTGSGEEGGEGGDNDGESDGENDGVNEGGDGGEFGDSGVEIGETGGEDMPTGVSILLQEQIDSLQEEMDLLQQNIDELQLKIDELEENISNIDGEIVDLENEVQNYVNSLEEMKRNIEDSIISILNEISDYVKIENSQLKDFYELMAGLYVGNIVDTLDFVIYLEGGNPNDYAGGVEDVSKLGKIGFFSGDISNIKKIESDIRNSKDVMIERYAEIYDLIKKQQEKWFELAEELKDNYDNLSGYVDDVSADFMKIFTIEDKGDDSGENSESSMGGGDEWDVMDENDVDEITLTGGSAIVAMDAFGEELWEVQSIFSNFIVEDVTGAKIKSIAMKDTVFLKWMDSKGIEFGNFSDSDWVYQYAQWASGPGFDSEGAINNHDFLLGVTEHEPGMNILTPDRPIDSPRYIVMQSVAGREMKFIYPDLFKVEVFRVIGKDQNGNDIHELLTGGEIKNNLVKYLQGKVDEYNKIIQVECDGALGMNSYFNKLNWLGYSGATPNKELHSCGKVFDYDELVESLGGENMLDVISETLYYQSLTNKRKLGSGNVESDIDLVRDSFSINNKREHTLESYLTRGNDEIKNMLFEIPTYDLSGYEVAYINSDGQDYIYSSDEIPSINSDFVASNYNVGEIQRTPQEAELDDECNIPLNGVLPIFDVSTNSSPRYDGFVCWLKKTREEPLKLKLTFDNSLGEILTADSVKDYIRNSDIGESFIDWKDSWSKYADDMGSILPVFKSKDSDKSITEMQVKADKHNSEMFQDENGLSNLMSKINNELKISNTNVLLSDSNPKSELRIESLSDIGNIEVEFSGTGDGCIQLNAVSLCNGNIFRTKFDPKYSPFTGVVTSSNHIAGKTALVMKIYVGGSYLEKIIKYTVSPSVLDKIDIESKNEQFVAGMLFPIEIIGYDKFVNKIQRGLEKYDFSVSQGLFLKDGIYQSGFSTNDFRNFELYYKPPLDAEIGSEAIIQVKSSTTSKVLGTYKWPIIRANPIIKLNGNTILRGDNEFVVDTGYKLTADESIYDGNKLNVGKLHRIDVDLVDSKGKYVNVNNQVIVSSLNDLVVLGQVISNSGNNIFFETSKSYLSGGHMTMYFYPTTVAGNDVISVSIPGLEDRVINLSILPAEPSNVQVKISNGYVKLNNSTDFEFYVSDVWGNPVNAELLVKYDPNKISFKGLRSFVGNTSVAEVKDGYLKTSVYGIDAGLTKIDVAGYGDFVVDVNKNLLPESGLNVMYLNYFGNDWGNQRGYFSDNDNYIESIMKKSDRIITTTTMLVSEDKIKKLLRKIGSGFRITNLENLNTTLMIKNGKLDLMAGGISKVSKNIPSFKWRQITVDTNISNVNDNYIFFIPSDVDYEIKDGILYDSGEKVVNILSGEVLLQLNNSLFTNGDNVWDLKYGGVDYGRLIIHYPSFETNEEEFEGVGDRYLIGKIFSKGSSDLMSDVGLFDGFSSFELDTSYKSIQNSSEIDERIGFLGDFKNITLFGEGEIVGEATKKFGSELLINLGDPVLSRKGVNKNVYGTEYDGGIGQEIFVDSENDIFGSYQIDFNKDGLKDWLIVYLDGSLKIAKNYGGYPDLRNMQELLRVAVYIKDVFVGDADGNGFEDIFVLTDNNQLRVYLNGGGKFDVDGSVACLNQNVLGGQISSTPTNLDGINQFFVEDMDLDGTVDIIVYDEKGYIKVFYGGSTKNGPNYLSLDKYSCDSGWYSRQHGNTVVVTALGVQVASGDVFDNSMIHWDGMKKQEIEITDSDLENFGVTFDPDKLESLIKERERDADGSIADVVETVMGNDSFDIKKASETFVDLESKFVQVTLFENTLRGSDDNNYVFAPSSFLDPKNPEDFCSVRKNYSVKEGGGILMDGDIVTVKVTVKASDKFACSGSYGDVIQGPWNVYYDENGIIKGIRFLENQNGAVVKKKDGNFSYIVDDITLKPGEKMIFEYDLEYHHMPLKKMSITHETFWSDDSFPDIKLQSVDGCIKNFDGFINSGKTRNYVGKLVDLQGKISAEYEMESDEVVDYADNIIKNGSDVNKLPGIIGNSINRIKLLKDGLDGEVSDDEEGKNKLEEIIKDGGISLNVDLSIFEEKTEEIEDIVDEITKGMCNGFNFGGSSNCKGLPVPFNQAFLAPGKYHLFGCWDLPMGPLEGGLPVFFFPGTLPIGPYEIPIPWGLKSPADGFLWPGGGTWSSLIRIYAAPTLTAQLGIAICMGKYMDEHLFPSPWADVGGNCVVFAVKPQCKKGDEGARKNDDNNPNEIYEDFVGEVQDSGICLQSQKGPQVTKYGFRSSPFNLYSFDNVDYEYGVNRDDIIVDEEQIDDILDDIQKLIGKGDVRKTWDDALKRTFNGIGDVVTLGMFDKIFGKDTIDKLYDKYFADAKLTAANPGSYSVYPDFDANFLGIIDLEVASYIGAADDSLNVNGSFFIGDVDVLGGNFSVNKIRGGIRQGLRSLLVDNWLDPQIRYIANQLTKMHVNIKLPNLSNLIGNEIQVLKDASDNASKILSNDANDVRVSPLTKWSNINYDNLKALSNSISNPFESLASLLNESNIINISTEPITVKVPWIFAEDINAYGLYLQQRLEVNQEIMNQWSGLLSSFVVKCDSLEGSERTQCIKDAKENLASFVEFEKVDWKKMQDQIYANLMVLQEYRNFPFEVYEWIHSIDRYLSEIASLISSTIGYLSYWTVTNSNRFVGYVDAIILVLNIIKTYQILIDFSIEWGQNCGNCTNDTYDQYSCKLSFLCNMIKLPIIQIPNFKLPNITIDLTKIDLGLDIILPEFNFQPLKINLPDLLNLPEPPSISMDIHLFNLPDIPVLPEPPSLPELPSFIPEIELELPILPPAPELPKIPNEIESILDVSKIIGKIYCIVKGRFGLVGESSVKAKIEQLTQRTYEVKWIDNIMDFTNWSVAPIHNYGLDYEISSNVDLQFNFSDFYTFLDSLTKSINNLSLNSVNRLNRNVDSVVSEENMRGVINSIDGKNIDVDMSLSKNDSRVMDVDVMGIESDEIEYVGYEDAKNRLSEVLTYFEDNTRDTSFRESLKKSLDKVENQINKKSVVNSNVSGIEDLERDVVNYLNNQRNEYIKLADLINNDYEGFLAMIGSQDNALNTKINSKSGQVLSFNVNLFDVDSSTKETIRELNKTNPYGILLDNKKEIIDGYWNAINSNTADDLGLSQSQYLVLRNQIGNMKNQITTLYSVAKPISSTELVAKNSGISTRKSLVSANEGARLGSNIELADVVDPSVFSKGIYEKINYGEDVGKLTKVVYSDYFVDSIGDRYYKTQPSTGHKIVLWNENGVYLKCPNQVCGSPLSVDKGSYRSKTLENIPYEETRIDFGNDVKLKIADANEEVKNWKVVGQSYDTLSFSWEIDNVSAYLIKLTDRVDHSYEKADHSLENQVLYVLALPDGVELKDLYDSNAKLELLRGKENIEKILGKEALVEIVYYNRNKNLANVVISNVDRKWYYARISALNFIDDTYEISSPWSNQIVAGKQIVGDDLAPTGVASLFRTSLNEVVSEGDRLQGYVGTKYKLNVNWEDNTALYYINLSKNGKILDEKFTSKIEDVVSTKIDIHTQESKEVYNSVGIDQFGNRTEKIINVNYLIPEITITDVSENSDGESVSITAELSHDIDQGNVSFQRRRGNVWKTMERKNLDVADIAIEKDQTIIVGSPYTVGNDIAMYNKDGDVIALMNPNTAEIKIQPEFEGKYRIDTVVQNGSVLKVIDKENDSSIFSISIPAEKCLKIEADNFSISDLPQQGKMGMFNGGKAIYKDGMNVLFVSPTCHLYSEIGLDGSYSYDREMNAVALTLYQFADKSNPIKIWFKVKPLLGE